MSEELEQNEETSAGVSLEGGTYEIIRQRLETHSDNLLDKIEQLNQSRKSIFGGVEQALLATERITTSNNCIPRDMAYLGSDLFLFGYNVQVGLRSETHLNDVFGIYKFAEQKFSEMPLDFIADQEFENDFKSLYKYYKKTSFTKFYTSGPFLYMVFQVGSSVEETKSFKWLVTDDGLEYKDNRSDHEVIYPAQHEFEWIRTHRDLHRDGPHPHVSIEDRLFVEAVGGDITFKIEDNTDVGYGIYDELVENKDQTLDDAEFFYSVVGNLILVKILPYQEENYRYFIYNEKLQTVERYDEIKDACVLLPDSHGLIFHNGYYLQTGEKKRFDNNLVDMVYERRLEAPNGEDTLYIFYNKISGEYDLLSYNLIQQKVDTPLLCGGYAFFPNGEQINFRLEQKPSKHHAIQIWQTPYMETEIVPEGVSNHPLGKIGNAELVRGMAECREIITLIGKDDNYEGLYTDLIKKATDVIDSYFWLDKEESFLIKETLIHIRDTAKGAVDEFEKVIELKRTAKQELSDVEIKLKETKSQLTKSKFDSLDDFVKFLAELRSLRGEIISLKDIRYMDVAACESMEAEVQERMEKLSHKCIEFLLKPDAMSSYHQKIEDIQHQLSVVEKYKTAQAIGEDIDETSDQLEMLIEIVSNLKVDDAIHTTEIIDRISSVFAELNGAREALKRKSKELMSREGKAEFSAQLKLLSHSLHNYLEVSDTPERCDENLSKLMLQVEELESKFADFDEFIGEIQDKRDEIYNAFGSKKVSLVEARNKKAQSLSQAADRILKGIRNRVQRITDVNEINATFASDLMIDKIRDLVERMIELGDTVRADDIQSQLKTIREDAVRQLKDKLDLFEDGDNIIRFGEHRFSVNNQDLDLTIVRREDDMFLHLTGTGYFEKIDDETFNNTRPVWDQEVVSENEEVYRGEYLTYQLLKDFSYKNEREKQTILEDKEKSLEYVQTFMSSRYEESYSKGIHDHDANEMFLALAKLQTKLGLLKYHPLARACAMLFWKHGAEEGFKSMMESRLKGYGMMHELFPEENGESSIVPEFEEKINEYIERELVFSIDISHEAARYMYYELMDGGQFVISHESSQLIDLFNQFLHSSAMEDKLNSCRQNLEGDMVGEYRLLLHWLRAFIAREGKFEYSEFIEEAAALLATKCFDSVAVNETQSLLKIEGLKGAHAILEGDVYELQYNVFERRLREYERVTVPKFNDYQFLKKTILEESKKDMRLSEFMPRILSSFVRNQLIDKVYLPVIGNNLAKQMGVVGENKRTDLMGLLLLISPPGYGKTTLMEYIADRLGIIFMKINGPALGHQVTSLDPNEAPNASAKEEVNKLNLALEMGDNVMIYLDDIQHCHPEFLQKFISLCDGQRRIEGVFRGVSKTYDLRGKKVAVVMAGNPYTESGEKFKVPDMLSNRADTYNLGDIIGGNDKVFAMSYIENSMTSNPVLNKMASKSSKDIVQLIKLSETNQKENVEFEGNYSPQELEEMVSVMKKLLYVRDVILKVNQQYIISAGQADEYRTEPAFKLQGSYRNMNRIAEKVLPIMNDEELMVTIMSDYESEAQTLTHGAEANLLKLKELIGSQSEEENARWEDIKRAFNKNQAYQNVDEDDPLGGVTMQLSSFNDGLSNIQKVLEEGVTKIASETSTSNEESAMGNEQLQAILEPMLKELGKSKKVPATNIKLGDKQALDDIKTFLSRIARVLERKELERRKLIDARENALEKKLSTEKDKKKK